MLFFNQFWNKKFTLVFITFLSMYVTSNDEAVRLFWGEFPGYFLALGVFLYWFLINFSIFLVLMFILYFLNKTLRSGLGVYTYKITDEGLVEDSPLGSLTMSWGSIVKVHKRKNKTYIERSGDHWSIILKEANGLDYDDFISLLLTKIV